MEWEDVVVETLELASYDIDAEARDFDIGMNVAVYGSEGETDTLIFLNQAKGAWNWRLGWGETSSVVYDENGYVAVLPSGNFAVTNLIDRAEDLDGVEPYTGTFRIYGQGEGRFRIDGNGGRLTNAVDTADLPTEIVNGVEKWYIDFEYSSADPDDTGAKMKIFGIDEDNYIQGIELIHHSHLDEYRDGEIFAPEFLEDLAGYDTLRFMEWMKAVRYDHNSQGYAVDPEARYIGTDSFTFNTQAGSSARSYLSSMPIEYIVELANELDVNAWIALPVDITDARVAEIGAYVADNLEAGLSVYWEYGNELWNSASGFEGYDYAELMGGDLFGLSGETAVVEWAAYRGPQVYDILDDYFTVSGTAEARFVAPLWAFDAPSVGGWDNADSYSRQYFAAAYAQALNDAPPAPSEIVTDYAIGMYYGGIGSAFKDYFETAYDTDSARAEALAKWVLFGNDTDTYFDLRPDALSAPQSVTYTEGMSISVAHLVRYDRWAAYGGVDPLTELDQVIRLEGNELQYRGYYAQDWTTILVFDTAPDKSLAEMIDDVELIGYGHQVYGDWRSGLSSSIANQARIRLDGHKDFVEELGLTWLAYEGGSAATGSASFLDVYRDEGWEALTLNAWFERLEAAGVDLYTHYSSHARILGDDDWGMKDYAGQPIEELPTETLIKGTIEASGGETGTGGTGDTGGTGSDIPDDTGSGDTGGDDTGSDDTGETGSGDTGSDVPGDTGSTDTGPSILSDPVAAFSPDAWYGSGWDLSGDGTAVESDASNGTLTLSDRVKVTPGSSYQLNLTVEGSQEDLGELLIVVRVYRGGVTQLLYWQEEVSDGMELSFDLGPIASPREKLEISFTRRTGRDGSLSLSDLTLAEVDPTA